MAALQARNLIRGDIAPAVPGRIVFNQLTQAFIEFVTQEVMPHADLHRITRAATDQLALLIATA